MPKWTDAQQQAIETRGQNLLVSAAAGSGKTAVLSARVADFVEKGGSLDRLLIVTFTNAAAGEMRSRIARDLAARAAAKPSDAHLRRQSLTLYKAKICTIDSYGMDLLRRNFQAAGISPDFSVLDQTELDVIQSAVLQRLMEEYYRKFPEGFGEFELLFGGDTDSSVMETVISSTGAHLESIPFGETWMEEQKKYLTDSAAFCTAACGEVLPVLEEYLSIFDQIIKAEPFPKMDAVQADFLLLEDLCTSLKQGDWDDVCRRVKGHIFQTAPRAKKDAPKEAWLYKEYRNRLKDYLLNNEIFSISSEQCIKDMETLRPALEFLFGAVKEYREEVLKEMHRRNAYSFATLAEMALGLTVADYSHETGTFSPTPTALAERECYDEVLIDEYQDVNDLQDLFFRAVTHNNCFAVGDVKQSIYGFRGSNPQNFLKKKNENKVICLNKNFRSKKGILDLVNFFFRGLFTADLGGICYDEGEMLFAGREPDEGNNYPPAYEETLPALEEGFPPPGKEEIQPDAELLIIPTPGRLTAAHYEEEARLCAKLIRDAVEGGATVFDKNLNGVRPMAYSDVAILLRTMKSASSYETVFREWGIPLLSADGETFLDSTEVCGALAFLQAVNDPWDDLALFIALTGSIFSLSPEQVAQARLKDKKSALWEGLKEYAKEDTAAQKAVYTVEKFRILAENLPVAKLLWEVYTQTDYLALESAASPRARGNLMKFYAFARRYSGNGGLLDFLEFVQRAKNSGKVREAGAAPDGDFVRLLSIHKSKGLEYAWCILPELERSGRPDRDVVRVDRDFGISPKVKEENGTAQYTTLMRELTGLRENRKDVAEELRVLYVALTRARDRLTMITRCSDKTEKLDALAFHTQNGTVRLIDRLDINCLRTPVLDRAVAHPDGGVLSSAWIPAEKEEGRLRVSFVGIPQNITPVSKEESIRCGLSEDELQRRFSFRYDNHLSTVPAKVSVTEISKVPADPDSKLLLDEPLLSKPKFLDESSLSGAETGTALHTFCQFADFTRPPEEEIARLVTTGHLTEQTAKALDRKAIQRFLDSDLAQQILSALSYQREVRFTCRIPVAYYTGNPGEAGEMLMQGAIDLLWETEEGYWILDFKSDRASEEELKQRYSRQVNLYATAVRRLYDKPVLGCKIWAFRLGKAIDVKEEDL